MRARSSPAVCAAGSLAAGVALAQPGTPGQAASPGGWVAVVPEAAVTTDYTVRPMDMTASNPMRTEVYNPRGERIGRIEDLVIGGDRELAAAGVGGFLGIGERHAALPPVATIPTRQPDGSMRAVVNAMRDESRDSPEFKFEGNVAR